MKKEVISKKGKKGNEKASSQDPVPPAPHQKRPIRKSNVKLQEKASSTDPVPPRQKRVS